MPALQAPATVLVTGANGFIAVHVVKSLLERGFKVVGVVRAPSKGDYIKNLFEAEYPGKFSYTIVEDIEKDGAFDEAVKDVDAVEHTASPFHLAVDEPEQLIGPAVKGTIGILRSIVKNGHNVKRVVLTSSVASVLDPSRTTPYIFTEEDWNTYSPGQVEEKGRDASKLDIYYASKTLAERAAWQFVEDNKDNIKWDLVTILPPFVFGPILHDVSSPESLNTSVAVFRSIVLSPTPKAKEELQTGLGSWVDVRDVALGHTEALLREEAGGERFLISSGWYTWQDFLDGIHSSPSPPKEVQAGFPGTGPDGSSYASGAKAAKILGIKYTSVAASGLDTVNSLLERFPTA